MQFFLVLRKYSDTACGSFVFDLINKRAYLTTEVACRVLRCMVSSLREVVVAADVVQDENRTEAAAPNYQCNVDQDTRTCSFRPHHLIGHREEPL